LSKLRDGDDNGQTSDFKLLSALFLLVDGELSRARLMSAEPPFFSKIDSLSTGGIDTPAACELSY